MAHLTLERSKKLPACFYQLATGREPVREWILQRSVDGRKRVGRDVQKVEFGWPIGMPYCRSLGRGLWEVRSDLSSDRIGRIAFCIAEGRMVLLNAFIKKTPATPMQIWRLR